MVIWGRARSAGAGGKGAPLEEAEERPLSAETAGLRLKQEIQRMRSIAEWLERLTANAKVLGSTPASSGTVESEG